eukprot:GILK01005612.1.p1 GENE.GILK01005612.1~~GILK01005612.1.p1  ORF type:complete len:604 (+),score=76.95 GILK01005612.1:146-1957(+)
MANYLFSSCILWCFSILCSPFVSGTPFSVLSPSFSSDVVDSSAVFGTARVLMEPSIELYPRRLGGTPADVEVELGTMHNGTLQGGQWSFYSISINSSISDSNLFVELRYSSSLSLEARPDPLLMMRANSHPSVTSSDGLQVQANKTDFNAFAIRRPYAHLLLSANDTQLGEIWYVAIYNFAGRVNQTLDYSLTVSATGPDVFPCPNGCSSNGRCLSSGVCECDRKYGNDDCSVRTYEMEEGNEFTGWLSPGDIDFFYFNVPAGTMTMVVEFSFGGGNPYLLFRPQTGDIYLPNDRIGTVMERVSYLESQRIEIPVVVGRFAATRWYVAVQNVVEQGRPMELTNYQISLASGDFNKQTLLVYILLTMAVIVVMLWMLYAIIRTRTRRGWRMDPSGENPQTQAARIQDVQARFPSEKFSAVKGRLKQFTPSRTSSIHSESAFGIPLSDLGRGEPTYESAATHVEEEEEEAVCSVCLVEFASTDDVRVLGCDHVYHNECIDRWFTSSTFCPQCRRDFSDTVTYEHPPVSRGRSSRRSRPPNRVTAGSPSITTTLLYPSIVVDPDNTPRPATATASAAMGSPGTSLGREGRGFFARAGGASLNAGPV